MKAVLLTIIFLTLILTSSNAIDRTDNVLLSKANLQADEGVKFEKDRIREIQELIYIGMPIEIFENKLKGSIIKKQEDVIYFFEPKTDYRARVTFYNGRLIKYERFARQFGTGTYYDITSALNKGNSTIFQTRGK